MCRGQVRENLRIGEENKTLGGSAHGTGVRSRETPPRTVASDTRATMSAWTFGGPQLCQGGIMDLWEKTTLGRTDLRTSRIGLGPGIEAKDVERAFERGINYLYWGSVRKPAFGQGIANLAPKHRAEMVVVVQTYTRVAWMMRGSLERA